MRKGSVPRFAAALALVIAMIPLAQVRSSAATFCATTIAPTTTVYLPNVTKTLGGPSGWDTPFYVQNAGAVQTIVEVAFFRFSDGSAVTCHTTSGLPPGASLVEDPNLAADLPGDTQFSVVVKSYGAPVVAVVNQQQGSGAGQQALSYSGFAAGATTVYLPNVTRKFFGYDVPLIVQNLGTVQASVSARFISFDGTQTMNVARLIDPGKSKVIDPDSDDPLLGAPGLRDGTQFAVTLTSNQPIGVIANAYTKSGAPVAFSHNGLATGATSLYAPYAVKSASLFSPIVVQNLAAVPVVPTLTFTPLGGGTPQAFTLASIPAGGARDFDPRFTLGTTTPCAIAVARACLGPGEYSLAITAATAVAAVVLPNSSATAAGYLASAAPNQRALLPVVMRTVGGPFGWNSTTYVQSTTATQATARWFAVTTGNLVATQQLTLVPGTTARIDPRGVAGLVDNASYAVTIDANGPIAAVVFEQAGSGGDAAMIYEGASQAALPFTGQAGSIRLSPATASLATGATQQFTATVRDQLGATLPSAPITWSVIPPTLGTVGPTGLFTAGSAGGTGTVVAASGTVSSSSGVTVTVPGSQTVGGISFVVQPGSSVDLYIESVITPTARSAIAQQVIADVAQIQTDWGRSFTTRPKIYVFASEVSYTTGLQTILFVPLADALTAGHATAGMTVVNDRAKGIGVNYTKSFVSRPYSVVRHELTHYMQFQIAPNANTPAWFDEGMARTEEYTITASTYWPLLNRASAASMAATHTLPSLGEMTDADVWFNRPSPLGYYQYYAAARAVDLMRSDFGNAALVRIYDLMAQGQTFANAFTSATGASYIQFQTFYEIRVGSFVNVYPAIATAPDGPNGAGMTIIVFGCTPGTFTTLSVSGPLTSIPKTYQVDQFGAVWTGLSPVFPSGTYNVTASGTGCSATATGVKTSSTFDASVMFDPGETGALELSDPMPSGLPTTLPFSFGRR